MLARLSRTPPGSFHRFPKFLLLGEGQELRREEVLLYGDGERRRVDFFRRSFGQQYWDIIELKSPRVPVVRGGASHHPHLSSELVNAISQAQDYRDLLMLDSNCRHILKTRGISVCRPRIVVVAGHEAPNHDPEILQVLYDRVRNGHVDLRSYTDVMRFAQQHYAATKRVLVVCAPVELLEYPDSFGESWGPSYMVGELFWEAREDPDLILGVGAIWGEGVNRRVLTFHEYLERAHPNASITHIARALAEVKLISKEAPYGSSEYLKAEKEYDDLKKLASSLLKSRESAERVRERLVAMGIRLDRRWYFGL